MYCVKRFLQVPHNDSAVNTSRADLRHLSATLLVRAQLVDRVLVHCRQLGDLVAARASAQVHSPEHVPRALLVLLAALAAAVGLFHGPAQLPSALAAVEAVSFAVVAGADDLALGDPEQVGEGQELRGDGDHGRWRLLWCRGVDYRNAAVVGCEGEGVARGREGDAVDPAGCRVQVLAADGVERQTLTPGAGFGTGVVAFDERAEDTGVAVGAAGGEQHAVGVPGDAGDGGAQRLLQVLGHPPVILLLEVADGDDAGAGADGELALVRAPTHAGSGAVDSQQDERWLPLAALARLPNVGVAVLRAGHNTAAVGCDVDTGDQLVVATKLILQAELIALLGVEFDVVGASNGQRVAVGGERVVGDWSVEQVVNFGRGHFGYE